MCLFACASPCLFLHIRICVRVPLEKTLPLQCKPNVLVGNLPLFHKSVCQDSGNFAVKKIQDAIIDSCPPDTQLINAISQEIGFRPPQFMTKLSQALGYMGLSLRLQKDKRPSGFPPCYFLTGTRQYGHFSGG